MADFSLPVLFVVPVGNSLPTSGGPENLTDGQFGIYKDEARTAATAGNVSSANFIWFFQGRRSLGLPSKRSDKIKAAKVKKWFKVEGNATAANQISEISGIDIAKSGSVTLTVRGHSQYLDTISANGFTRSVTVPTACLDCGEDPCTNDDPEDVVDALLAKIAEIAAVQDGNANPHIATFFNFEKIGTGSSVKIRISAKAITKYGKFCNVALEPHEFDRVWFRAWLYEGPETTVDFLTTDRCKEVAVTTVIQRANYARLTSDEVKQLEIDYYSYQSGPFKHLFQDSAYNQYFESQVTDGQLYDQYLIQFDEIDPDDAWQSVVKLDERVLLFIPNGSTATIETLLEVYLGNSVDESGVVVSTTTTTSTTSTTTTSTTTLIP